MLTRPFVQKRDMISIKEKNVVVGNIIKAMDERDNFLIIGHQHPDEDCLASMVAFALLLSKMTKKVTVSLCGGIPDQFSYLVSICSFNSINIFNGCDDVPKRVSTIVALDTPKQEMLEMSEDVKVLFNDPNILRIEVDHHLEADASYCGDPGYCLVADASSTCELIGLLTFKLQKYTALLKKYVIRELFTRNLVLAILTGIIGDSKMGKYLKTRKERWFYDWFSRNFDEMLAKKTRKGSVNFTSKEQVFAAIANLSGSEGDCFNQLLTYVKTEPALHSVVLTYDESMEFHRNFGQDTLGPVMKALADKLAEDSGYLGLVGFADSPEVSDLYQFRMRRSQNFMVLDLRDVLLKLKVENGGGHPGAVGFRYPQKDIPDPRSFADQIIRETQKMIEQTFNTK